MFEPQAAHLIVIAKYRQDRTCEVSSAETWKLREKPSALSVLIHLRQTAGFQDDGAMLAPDTASVALCRDPRTILRALHDLEQAHLVSFAALNACPLPKRQHPGRQITTIYWVQPWGNI